MEFLAEDTSADRIHIIGYSAGTRAVLTALDQLRLARAGRAQDEIRRELRLGTVALIGSDADRGQFGGMLADGLLDLPQRLAVYVSQVDNAMMMSGWVFARDRLGEALRVGEARATAEEFLEGAENLELIDVTGVEDAKVENGHGVLPPQPVGIERFAADPSYRQVSGRTWFGARSDTAGVGLSPRPSRPAGRAGRGGRDGVG
jgi:esterase/lipase superfamily enzyme